MRILRCFACDASPISLVTVSGEGRGVAEARITKDARTTNVVENCMMVSVMRSKDIRQGGLDGEKRMHVKRGAGLSLYLQLGRDSGSLDLIVSSKSEVRTRGFRPSLS